MMTHTDAYYNGYEDGVREAVEYIRDALGIDVTDSDQLQDMAGGDYWNE